VLYPGKDRATQDVFRRNLFPFSLSGGVRTWYRCFGYKHLNWGALKAAFCIRFFPLRRIISLRIAILSFQQREKESLGMAWDHFAFMTESCPVLGLLDLVLLEHFRFGLLRDNDMALDAMSGGNFVFLEPELVKEILEKLLDFSSPPILSTEVANHSNESPKPILERVRAYIPTFSTLSSKMSFLTSRNLWERTPSVSSALRFPYRFFS
jgi:hypothetical protein